MRKWETIQWELHFNARPKELFTSFFFLVHKIIRWKFNSINIHGNIDENGLYGKWNPLTACITICMVCIAFCLILTGHRIYWTQLFSSLKWPVIKSDATAESEHNDDNQWQSFTPIILVNACLVLGGRSRYSVCGIMVNGIMQYVFIGLNCTNKITFAICVWSDFEWNGFSSCRRHYLLLAINSNSFAIDYWFIFMVIICWQS